MKTEKENKKMKKLLMIVGAAAVAVGAYAVEYTYTGGTVFSRRRKCYDSLQRRRRDN